MANNLQTPVETEGDEIDFFGLLDTLIDSRWLIATIAFIGVFLGFAYALLSTPIYEANTLIQVEDSKPGAAGALGDAAALFEIKSPASAEMEILRSRLVLGQVVDGLHLNITASPRYVPIVGRWLARKASKPSEPGLLFFDGLVYGAESIRISSMKVPSALEGVPLILKTTATGFELATREDGAYIGSGKIGENVELLYATESGSKQTGSIRVAELIAKPGAEFTIVQTSRLAEIEDLQRSLNISELGKQSGVISVKLQGDDAKQISEVLTEIGNTYVRQNTQRKSAEAEKTLTFLDGFLPQFKKQLDEAEAKFNQFRNKNGTFDLSEEGRLLLNTSVALQTRLIDLQQKRREQSAQFTVDHPSIQILDAQIEALNKEIGELGSKTKSLPNTEQDLLRLQRDVKVNTDLYVNLLNSAQQLQLVKEGRVGNVRVVDPAAMPEKPVKPSKPLVVVSGTLIGLMGGVALAFLRKNFSAGISDPDQIEVATGLHVFATVPHSEKQDALAKAVKLREPGTHLLAVVEPNNQGIESLRSLRTALQFAMLEAKNNIVLITGPTPGIGKSFTSVNFSAVLAAAGKRILLIDADLRKGHVHQYFGLGRDVGFSDLILGTVSIEKAIRSGVAPGLDFLSTGSLPPNPAELLMSGAAAGLVLDLSERYDIVIIDTPPVLAVSDTQAIAPVAGTVFLLARAGLTTLGELHETSRRLSQSGVTARGVIFNDLDISKRRYSYGYGYRYRYGYKYSRYKYANYEYGKTNDIAS